MMDDSRKIQLLTRHLERSTDAWLKAAERALEVIPGASNSSHPAYSLWLRVQMHRNEPISLVLSSPELIHEVVIGYADEGGLRDESSPSDRMMG